tara:strand:+ start:1912 stop:2145 length:234 start_codon:yes stop_codon:yes gene_type:complete
MSVSPIDPIGPISTLYSNVMIPLQSADGFKQLHRTEFVDQQGRVMATTEVALITYDRFAKLQTIPSPHYNSTTSETV